MQGAMGAREGLDVVGLLWQAMSGGGRALPPWMRGGVVLLPQEEGLDHRGGIACCA